MANITPCGSLFFNNNDFTIIEKDGAKIVTDATSVSVSDYFKASCGLAFDSLYFKPLLNTNLSPVPFVTVQTVSSASSLTGSPCAGTLFDSGKFTLTDNVISYGNAMNAKLTFDITPADATIELTDNLGNTVTVTNKAADVVLNRTYHYKVSKAGYVTETDSVVINDDLEVTISLEEHMTTLTITTTPSDATINVVDSNETEITPTTTGVYPVQVTKEYTYTVSKEGYVAHTDSVVITGDLELDITLEPTP